MRQQEVFNKIGSILKELNDQYKYLEANPDDMNSLELELFVANAHFLADHAEILNKINLQLSTQKPALPPAKEELKAEEKYFEPVVRQPAKSQSAANDKEEPSTINFEISPAADDDSKVLKQFEQIAPDMVLLDNWLTEWKSDANGQQISWNLKTNPATKHIPVVIISA